MDKPTVTIHCEERNSPDDNSQNLLALVSVVLDSIIYSQMN